MKPKLVIATTIPLSLNFYKGQIGALKEKFEVELISSSGDRLTAISSSEDVNAHVVEMHREIAVFNDLKSLWRLYKKLKVLSPTLVLGSTPKAGLLSMIASFLAGVDHRVYYLHGLRYDGLTGNKKRLLQLMEKLSCFFATKVVSVSHGVKKRLVDDKITSKPINIIHNGSINGINPACFNRELFDLKYNPKGFTIGYVGRLVGDKGVNELVQSFIQVSEKFPDLRLLLVGNYESDLDPLYQETLQEIKMNKHIVEVGFQSDVRPFLAQMDVFVFPSYREGFGVSVMEALCMEVPVIVSDIIGCNEIVEHKSNGLIIAPRSIEDLTEALIHVLKNPNDLKSMQKNARSSVVSRYSQAEVWQHTVELYSSFIEE